MARKPSTRKRREPAPPASKPDAAAASKRPTTKPGAACLERVLTRDATHFNLVAQLIDWCGCAAPLAALDATSKTCAEAARTPVKLALTTATEAQPLASLVRSHASRRKLSMAATGRRLVVIEAPDGAHANVALEATEGGLYRPQAAPPGVRVVATGAADALANCGVLILDTSKLGPAARARRVVRRLALETTAWQGSDGNRLQHEIAAMKDALDEMGRRTAKALDVPLCQAIDLILAVGAAAADVEDGRMTLEAVRRACAAAPRSAAASRQDRASRRRVDPSAWFGWSVALGFGLAHVQAFVSRVLLCALLSRQLHALTPAGRRLGLLASPAAWLLATFAGALALAQDPLGAAPCASLYALPAAAPLLGALLLLLQLGLLHDHLQLVPPAVCADALMRLARTLLHDGSHRVPAAQATAAALALGLLALCAQLCASLAAPPAKQGSKTA